MRTLSRFIGAAGGLVIGSVVPAFADKPLLVQTCTRSTLCGATVVQFEEAADFPRRPMFLEPEGSNVSPVGGGLQKLNNNAVGLSGSTFLWAPAGGAFPAGWFTVAVWIYPTTAGSSGQAQTLLSEDGDNLPGNTLDLYNAAGAGVAPRIRLRDGIDPQNGSLVTATWGSTISLNTWHLVVVRLRPKTFISNGELSIQVDNGTPVVTAVSVATWGGGGRLFAGKANAKGSENFYSGYMDQLAIAGVRWTDQETGLYWNGGAGLQYPFITGGTAYSTPTSHWRFDRVGTGGSRTLDDAAGGNDAQLAGGMVALGTGGPLGYSADFTAGYISASSANFDPLSLSPTLWLKADTIAGLNDGNLLATWYDQSGNGRDMTQATGGNKPTYKTGIINGLPVTRWNGTSGQMKNANVKLSNLVNAQAGTIFAVASRNNHTLPTALFGNGATTLNIGFQNSGNPTSAGSAQNNDGNQDGASKATDSAFHVYMWQHDATNVYAAVNDARDSGRVATASGATASLTSAFTLGYTNDTTPASWHDGDIAELIAFNTVLSESDRENVETYLANKYAITLPYSYNPSPNDNLKTQNRAFSIEGWFKVGATSTTQGLVASRSGNNGWEVHFNQPTGKLQFKWGDGTTNVTLDDTTAISAGTWYYFVARYDGTSAFKVSVNGASGGATTSATHPSDSSLFYFGTTDDGTSSKLTGSLSSVSWHKGLYLSDSEITAHYNSGSGRACCPIK